MFTIKRASYIINVRMSLAHGVLVSFSDDVFFLIVFKIFDCVVKGLQLESHMI